MTHQDILGLVGVLKFIHQNMLKQARIALFGFGDLLHQVNGIEQEVVEIQGVAGEQQFLITAVDTRCYLIAVIPHREVIRQQQFVLGIRDDGVNRLRTVAFLIEVEVCQRLTQDSQLVFGVVDDKIGVKGQMASFTAQDAGTAGMESAEG